MADGFDTKKFHEELGRVFGEYRQYNRRSLPVLLEQLGSKLSIDAYLEAAKLKSAQKAKIDAVPEKFGYRVRRRLAANLTSKDPFARFKRGARAGQFKSHGVTSSIARSAINRGNQHVSIDEEIRLRKRFAAIFQASGWISELTVKLKGAFKMKTGAIVVKQLSGPAVRIEITNPRQNSAEYAGATGYLNRAFQNRIADMRGYIQRKMNEDAGIFSQPKPHFNAIDPKAAVDRALAGAFSNAA